MLKLVRKYLEKIINDIDAGNSNITEDEGVELLEYMNKLTNREKPLSKYEACRYLRISRATFDNYVREGRLPKGKHSAGFKEKFWTQKDLDNFIKEYKK